MESSTATAPNWLHQISALRDAELSMEDGIAFDVFWKTSDSLEDDLQRLLSLEAMDPQTCPSLFTTASTNLVLFRSICEIIFRYPQHWLTFGSAPLLFDFLAFAKGKTLMLAEICWIKSLSRTERALVSGAPVTITSVVNDNLLYAAGDGFDYNSTNRSVFCWNGEWEADQRKEVWRFVRQGATFSIISQFAEEHLVTSDVKDNSQDFTTNYVFTRREKDLTGLVAAWKLVSLEEDEFHFYNQTQNAYLVSPSRGVGRFRRDVRTSKFRPFNCSWDESRTWVISAAEPPLMERALEAFFCELYQTAVRLLTELLATDVPTDDYKMKVLGYRLVANVILRNKGLVQNDYYVVKTLGGIPKYFLEVLSAELPEDKRKMLHDNLEDVGEFAVL